MNLNALLHSAKDLMSRIPRLIAFAGSGVAEGVSLWGEQFCQPVSKQHLSDFTINLESYEELKAEIKGHLDKPLFSNAVEEQSCWAETNFCRLGRRNTNLVSIVQT